MKYAILGCRGCVRQHGQGQSRLRASVKTKLSAETKQAWSQPQSQHFAPCLQSGQFVKFIVFKRGTNLDLTLAWTASSTNRQHRLVRPSWISSIIRDTTRNCFEQ
jgi:hypothetical protein